jgi:Uma2 family endonuclease
MTDAQFLEICEQHPDEFVEVTAGGEVKVTPPGYLPTGARSAAITAQLGVWAEADGRGVGIGCTGGYVLPNGARRSADAAWFRQSRISALSEEELDGFWRLCPDFLIELKSEFEALPELQAKMREWIANGVELAWLIDPERKIVEVHRPGAAPEILNEPAEVHGEGPVAGFVLKMERIWRV